MSRIPSMSNGRARRLCRALGWTASEWAAHARGLLSAIRDWPWRAKVRVLVQDLAPHDGAGYCAAGTFPADLVQFRALGSGRFAKGVLLPREMASLTGVEVPEAEAVLSPDQFKGQKPEPGEVVEMTLLARPLLQGRQRFSWQALLFFWAAMESREEKEALWKDLLEATKASVAALLAALTQALAGDLYALSQTTQTVEVPSLEALRVFGVTQETSRLLKTWAVHEVADLIRSGGLVGERLLLVMSEHGSTLSREEGDLVVVRTPVRRPQGVATVKPTPQAQRAMRRGVMLLHPQAAKALDGDDDGDFVAVFQEPWLVEASRKLARLDPLFQDAVKGEKKRRVLGLEDEDFALVQSLVEDHIGLATLTLFHKVVKGQWDQAAHWSEVLQQEVDRLKWEVGEVDQNYDCAPFPWRKTPRCLSGFSRVQPLGKQDLVAYLWNHAVPTLQEAAQALGEAPNLAPIDFLAHLKPQFLPLDKGLLAKANALAAQWAADWAQLRLLHGDEVPEEEVQALRARYRALGERMSARELAAVVASTGTFAFKNTLVGLRWTEVCEARPDARKPHVTGWVELPAEDLLTGAFLGLGETFWVRLRKVSRGEVEVVLSANRWAQRHTLGVGRAVGRLGRSFRGRLVALENLIPGADRTLVVVPAEAPKPQDALEEWEPPEPGVA